MSRLLDPFHFVVITVAGWMNQRHLDAIDYLREENRVLREQLGGTAAASQRRSAPPTGVEGEASGAENPQARGDDSHPDTLLAWPPTDRAEYDGSAKRKPGRPRKAAEIESLVVTMAKENRLWGYRRIEGALLNLGHDIAHSTIAVILHRHGIEPAPEPSRRRPGRSS